MPDNFINEEGNYVTEDFKHYLLPLLGNDLPQASRLSAPKVKKILSAE